MQARDPLSGITEAEQKIEERKKDRPANPEERRNMAIEAVADELARLQGEVKTLRHLFATYIVRQTPSQIR